MQLPGPGHETWDRLAQERRNIFLTRDFAEAWWATYRPPGAPMILTDRPDRPRCILPLYRTRGPVPLVRQIGHGPADALGPLCAPDEVDLVARVVREELRTELRRGLLVLHDAAVDRSCVDRFGGTVVRATPGPAVRLGMPSWEAFLASRSKNFREQVRRKERRLRQNFQVTVRMADGSSVDGDLSTLFRLHRMRWGDDAPFATGRQAELARMFSLRAMGRDRLRLAVMELDGRPVAALLGLRFAGVHSFWQSGRDPRLEEHSVGSVLLMHALREAVEDGASEYRLLRGDEAYKKRLADLDRATLTVAFTRGWPGRVAVRAARGRRAVRGRLPGGQGTG